MNINPITLRKEAIKQEEIYTDSFGAAFNNCGASGNLEIIPNASPLTQFRDQHLKQSPLLQPKLKSIQYVGSLSSLSLLPTEQIKAYLTQLEQDKECL